MSSRYGWLWLAVLAASTSLAWADDAANIARGKKATALVEVTLSGGEKGAGSAFCIDPAGYFITNEHVVESARQRSRLTLVLNPGETDQQVLTATVVREDKTADLAVLKVNKSGLTALDLGDTDKLAETQGLTAFGYPFGRALTENREEYPNVSVSTGKITSLRKNKGVLHLIQLDASLSPGNSGGPVVDDQGLVIGVVQSGVMGAGGALNFAIPVIQVRSLLERPDVTFEPKPVAFDKRTQEQDFSARVVQFVKTPADYTVELELQGAPAPRVIAGTSAGGGVFNFRAAPVMATTRPATLRATVTFSTGTLSGTVADGELNIGGVPRKLSSIARLERQGSTPSATLTSGQTITGAITGAEATVVDLGDAQLTVDLAKAARVELTPPPPPASSVPYTLRVKAADKVVLESTGTLTFSESPPSAVAGRSSTPGGQPTITAPHLDGDSVSVQLPATIDDVAEAGGGRYLLLHLKKLRQLGVFDVSEAKVVKYLPLADDEVFFAGGLDKVVVVLPTQKLVQRWSLRTLEKEFTAPLNVSAEIDDVSLGSASAGPVMVMTRQGAQLFELSSFRKIDLKDPRAGNWTPHPQYPYKVGVSADGTTFAAWEPGLSPSGIRYLRYEGRNITTKYLHETAGVLLPSFDGRFLFTSAGVYTDDLKIVDADKFRGVICVPSTHPAYFMGVTFTEMRAPRGQTLKPALSIYSTGDRRLLLTLPADDLGKVNPYVSYGDPGGLSIAKRLHLIPSANLLAIVSEARDEIILRHVDLLATMEKDGIDYFFVSSLPVRTATKGTTYRYAIETKSRKGSVVYRLEAGPTGMAVSTTGVLTWMVPSAMSDPQAAVIVAIKDSSGQELYHSFNITLK